ncbi:MAG: cell division protein ZapB [Thermodesulfobacteriota bacterium]
MALEKFDRLEEGLGRLLFSFENLQSENLELRDALEAKELETRALKEKMARLEEEKLRVRKKVDTLLSKLDGLTQSA